MIMKQYGVGIKPSIFLFAVLYPDLHIILTLLLIKRLLARVA